MYTYELTPRGYAIYFIYNNKAKEYISDHLTLKQAKNWTERLNNAYKKGFYDGSY